MAEALSATYDVLCTADLQSIDFGADSVWVLGAEYLPQDREAFAERIQSLLWFTYRTNFRAIGGTGKTTDGGWGCTIRCGQMLLAEALVRRHLGQSWRWHPGSENEVYHKILHCFLDRPEAVYSIQQIAQCGVDVKRPVGEWFGPNNICQVIKKLSNFDQWSNLTVLVPMDFAVVESEIRAHCWGEPLPQPMPQRRPWLTNGPAVPVNRHEPKSNRKTSNVFRPLLLFIPLRLGLERIDEKYWPSLKACLRVEQSVGFVGGQPRMAFWFIGYEGDRFLFLDPHTYQPSVMPKGKFVNDESFHTDRPGKLDMRTLDPSVALGFFARTSDELEDLFVRLRELTQSGPPMFEVFSERPTNMPAVPEPLPLDQSTDEDSFTMLQSERVVNDEEYDIIEMDDVQNM